MRCASKAASEAAARMRTAGEQATQDSAAAVSSPAAANEQPATSNVVGALCHPRAVLHPQLRLRVIVPWTSTPN